MSKFFCSNNTTCVDTVLRHCGMFPVHGRFTVAGFDVVAFDKISRHHTDFKRFTNGDCVFVFGTPLLKEGVLESSITDYIWDSFSSGGIERVKKNVVGIWTVLISKNNILYIFNDYYGLYDICYSQEGDNFLIGNSLSDVARCRLKREIEEFPFIMEIFNGGAFEGQTSFKDIFKLKHDEYLRIEDGLLVVDNVVFDPIRYEYQNESKAIEDIAGLVLKYARLMSKQYGSMMIGMTGGLDSRLVFSAFNSVGTDITFKHGVSSGTMREDREIVEELSKAYSIPLVILDWNQPLVFSLSDQEAVF